MRLTHHFISQIFTATPLKVNPSDISTLVRSSLFFSLITNKDGGSTTVSFAIDHCVNHPYSYSALNKVNSVLHSSMTTFSFGDFRKLNAKATGKH